MPKITPMQSLLLTHAAARENGSLFPLPQAVTHPPTVRRSIAALLSRGWLKARQTEDATAFAHLEGNIRYGVFITSAGCAAVGANALVAERIAPQTGPQRETKAAKVIALLLRDGGATLNELIEATGWLPHTTRAALTGLRKKGHVLEKAKQSSGLTFYRIIAE
ncbi:DUF3489 domain-containing protein [Sphingomonas sp. IC4-52]|uniref:DUF3489 domain-containing protein n=1 Tax=Sphingomonas sp. IC4-52 TaxID=2887202 RepID=UPI001D10EE35|nr:DUF3489 domain-containing protein [Sphingomonas sp. IC4-52]MCC2980808.1 DUF3489 domain-containing protein [Sphingomonas sp. IC4-52]